MKPISKPDSAEFGLLTAAGETNPKQTAKAMAEAMGMGPYGCKCQTLAHRVVGDGCEICNPEFAKGLEDER